MDLQEQEGDPKDHDRLEGESEDEELEETLNILNEDEEEADMGRCDDAPMPDKNEDAEPPAAAAPEPLEDAQEPQPPAAAPEVSYLATGQNVRSCSGPTCVPDPGSRPPIHTPLEETIQTL